MSKKNSTLRRERLEKEIEIIDDIMPRKYNYYRKKNRIYRVYIKSGRYS